MPTVKKYTERVEERPLSGPSVSQRSQQLVPDAYGSPMAEAGQYFGKQVERFGAGIGELALGLNKYQKTEAEKYDRSVIRQRESEDRTWAREFLTSQYENYKGENAIKAADDGLSVYERTKQTVEKHKRERLKNLDNEQQRSFYGVIFNDIEQRMLADSTAWVRNANTELEKQSYLASAESKYEDIIANRDDDKRIAADLDLAERDLKNYLTGAPAEFVAVELQNYRDKVHYGIVQSYVKEKNPTKAWEYFQSNQKDISAPVKAEAQETLKNASLEYVTRLKTRELQIDPKFKTFKEKLDAVNTLQAENVDSLELQKRVKEKLLADYSVEKQLKIDQEHAVFETSVEAINNTRTYAEALEIARAAKGSDELKLRKIANDVFGSGGIQTDWTEYRDLQLMPYSEFIAVDLLKFRHVLADTEFKELVRIQAKEKNDQKPVRVRTNLAMANDALESVGLYEDKKSRSRSEQRVSFFADFESRLDEIQEKTGKEPTTTEAKEAINDLLLEFYEKSRIPAWVPFVGKDEKLKFEINAPEERADTEYVPAERPAELPKNAKWNWGLNGWMFDYEGKNYVLKNKKVYLIPGDKWKVSSR
jgi:hypothetical protein